MNETKLSSTKTSTLSPWVTLKERSITRGPDGAVKVFHSLSIADYVTVLAITSDNKVVLVQQYRPAIQSDSLELPGGMVELGEVPALSAERELFEETGYRLKNPLIDLGVLTTDVGRLENRLWAYFAIDVEHDPTWLAEEGVQSSLMDLGDFKSAVCDGEFNNALHIALLGIAQLRALI